MRDLDDAALERRLRDVLETHLGALPLNLTVDALERRRGARVLDRRVGRRRSMTLLAAAALFLVGGALAVGSDLLRRTQVVLNATASPDATFTAPRESTAPSAPAIPVAGPGGFWIPVGSMGTPRSGKTAVRLNDGRVLVVGGETDDLTGLSSAELYDPVTGTWSTTGDMTSGGWAALLHDGTVLVRGAVYDPASGTWTATGPMVSDDGPGATATVLRDGKVLVA